MNRQLLDIFQKTHRELRPRTPLPEIEIQFFRFANVNNTIRLRDGRILVRLSDLLEGAPESVLAAIAHILVAKLYRKPLHPHHTSRYRKYVSSHDFSEKAHLIRQIRGRKRVESAQGHVYDLEAIFDDLNMRFFHGLLGRPQMTWSRELARNSLGHYDPAHNTIVVSRVFDREEVPRHAIEYLVYHEMLHLKHPVKLRGTRRCVHSAAFQAEEKLFPHLEDAKKFLKTL
ncbi:MAG: M48 family metallopeptidase [Acidobacteriaceae bacterium]|nr:M48 family metallopeptidase [Acidobacteriaceae bacterium]